MVLGRAGEAEAEEAEETETDDIVLKRVLYTSGKLIPKKHRGVKAFNFFSIVWIFDVTSDHIWSKKIDLYHLCKSIFLKYFLVCYASSN